MLGGFYCPYCKLLNACDCKACKPFIKEGQSVIGHTEDNSALICYGCKSIFTYNQALDTEWEIHKQQTNEKTSSN